MKLCRLLAILLFAPEAAFPQCANGPPQPVCQQTVPVITSPLTMTCAVGATECDYQASATGNVGQYNIVAIPTTTYFIDTTTTPGLFRIIQAPSGGPMAAGTFSFQFNAASTTGLSIATVSGVVQ